MSHLGGKIVSEEGPLTPLKLIKAEDEGGDHHLTLDFVDPDTLNEKVIANAETPHVWDENNIGRPLRIRFSILNSNLQNYWAVHYLLMTLKGLF